MVVGNGQSYYGPVVVGGGGGSGTRVVAQILKELGFYLGADLNPANDNLWFTLLFKRPRWFSESPDEEVFKGLRVFEKAMTGGLGSGLQRDELRFITSATTGMVFSGHNHKGWGRGLWPIKRAAKMFLSKREVGSSACATWGWKEPNTHVYIRYLNDYFDNLKYIHVMRHGLDMAYSTNQAQLYSWGRLFGVQMPNSIQPLPKASLEYWIKSNTTALALGKRLLGGRFFVVNFDRLCSEPRREVKKLVRFLDMDENNVSMDELCSLPKTPLSAGRYRRCELGIFDKDEIDAVRKLGFTVDGQA